MELIIVLCLQSVKVARDELMFQFDGNFLSGGLRIDERVEQSCRGVMVKLFVRALTIQLRQTSLYNVCLRNAL